MTLFSFIKRGKVHLGEGRKVIPAEEFSDLLTAQELIAEARSEAEEVIAEAVEEAKAIKERAQEEGFQEGLKELNQHILSLDAKAKEFEIDLQKQILPLALKAAKKIVADQLQLHPETIVEIVLKTIKPLTQTRHVRIFVSKEDLSLVESHKPEVKKILDLVQTLAIEERSDITPGGCIIETEMGIINATIENQWRALEAAFERLSTK